jgi:hypothetical protein
VAVRPSAIGSPERAAMSVVDEATDDVDPLPRAAIGPEPVPVRPGTGVPGLDVMAERDVSDTPTCRLALSGPNFLKHPF